MGAAPVIKSRAMELLRGVCGENLWSRCHLLIIMALSICSLCDFSLGVCFLQVQRAMTDKRNIFNLVWWGSESYWRWGYLLRHGHIPQTKTFLSITVSGLQIYWEGRGLVYLVRILLCILSADALRPDLIRVLLQEITAAEIWTRQLQQGSLQNGVGS